MRITLHHRLCFLTTQTLQLMCWRTRFPVPGGEGMPQIMPTEIMDAGPEQRVTPCLGVDLDDWISLIRKNMSRVIALTALQNLDSGVIEWH